MPVILRRVLYFLLGLLGLVLLLVVGVVVALQFDGTQDFVARKAETYLRNKLGTEVKIGKFRTDFRHAINLDDVYLADQRRDTLLAVGHLGVSLDLWALASKQVSIKSIELTDGRIRLTRTEPDSVNNYDFIIRAFTDPTAPVDTTASGLKYNIGEATLRRVYFTQLDAVTGTDTRARIGTALIHMDEVDVDKSVYKVEKAALAGTSVSIRQTKTAPEVDNPAPTAPLTVQFGLKELTLDSVSFTYRNDPAAQYIGTTIGQAALTAKNIDLQRQRIDLQKLTLTKTTFAYAQNEAVPVAQRVVNPAEAVRKLDAATDQARAASGQPLRWRVSLAQSAISDVDVKFDNFNQPRQLTRLPALDYNHLHFSDLVLNTRNLAFSENRTTALVENLAGRESSGFRIDSWRAAVVYDSVQIRLDSLDLVTPHTRIRRSLGIGFASLNTIADNLAQLKISGDLRDTRIGFRDILYLAPQLAGTPPFTTGPNQSVLLNGQIAGRVGDFTVRNLEFVGLRNTVLKARRGRIQGLPNTDARLLVDVDITQFRTSREDINSLVPKGTLPANISLPPVIALRGTFRGRPTTLQFNTNLTVNTSYGDVAFSGDLGAKQASGRQPLLGTFALRSFDAGKLLKNPQLGRITATGRINASGNLQDPATLVGQVQATVQRAEYGGYAYRGIAATVGIDRNKYAIKATSRQDPNLAFDLTGNVNLRDPNTPAYAFDVKLKGANLKALKLYDGDLRVQGDFAANLRGANLDALNGTFAGRRVVVVRDNVPFALDSLDGKITQTVSRTAVVFTSSILDAKLDGNVRLGQLAPELQGHIDRYFHLAGVAALPTGGAERQFTYAVRLKDAALATKLVPGLKEISPFALAGDYSRRAARLTANAAIPRIRYQNYRLDSLRLAVTSDPQKLDYDLHLAQASQDTTLRLRRPSLVGNVAQNKLNARVAILGDSSNRERLALAGALSSLTERATRNKKQETIFQFEAAPDQIINYEKWTAGAGNFLRYYAGSGGVVADKLNLTNGRSSLAVQSRNPAVAASPLGITFTKFDLAEIARAVQQQDSLVAGTLDGTAEVRGLGTKNLAFTADATLTGLVFQKALIGDVALRATNNTPGRYDVDARLTGGTQPGHDVALTGYYLASGPAPLHFEVDMRRLNLKLIEPFSAGQVAQTQGYASGKLTVLGSPAAPQVRGAVTTSDDAQFVVPQLGAPYRLVRQTLTLDEQGIKFDDFTVTDSAGHKAVANGYLRTRNLVDYRFDLTAVTNNFTAVRSTRKNNPLFYGRLVLDSETRLSGPLTLIDVDTRVTVADGSNLTVESPAADPSKTDTEGIVQFVDKSAPLDSLLARRMALDTANTGVTGYNIKAVVTVTRRTPFTLIIDPVSGDNLRLRAEGTLNTTLDSGGNIGLSGRLAVARGRYRLSLYGLSSKEFVIRPGSSLTWNGDPYNAELDLTAIYRVQAAPADLLAGQGLDDATSNTVARNRLPFNVLLNVTEQLSKPAIGFDITLPENQQGALGGQVEARLAQLRQPSQSSEQSKQVFSLLSWGASCSRTRFRPARARASWPRNCAARPAPCSPTNLIASPASTWPGWGWIWA